MKQRVFLQTVRQYTHLVGHALNDPYARKPLGHNIPADKAY